MWSDFFLACNLALSSTLDLEFNILEIENLAPPRLLTSTFKPLLKNENNVLKNDYELLINLNHSDVIKSLLPKISCKKISGLIDIDQGLIQGRWAQTFFTQLATNRFAPFSAFDLFYNCIVGQRPKLPSLHDQKRKKIYIDVKSISNDYIDPSILQGLAKNYFQIVTDVKTVEEFEQIKWYIGSDIEEMKLANFYGADCISLAQLSRDLLDAPLSHAYILNHPFEMNQFESLLADQKTECDEWTNEFSGGVFYKSVNNTYNIDTLFQALDYIVFNFINSMIDIHLPSIKVRKEDELNLKNHINLLQKIKHLNLFAIKELHSLLNSFEQNTITDESYHNITAKLSEIDELTEKTLSGFQSLDFINFYFKLSKTSAPGENLIEIAKSLILTYHDYNQVIDVYDDLTNQLIKGAAHEGNL